MNTIANIPNEAEVATAEERYRRPSGKLRIVYERRFTVKEQDVPLPYVWSVETRTGALSVKELIDERFTKISVDSVPLVHFVIEDEEKRFLMTVIGMEGKTAYVFSRDHTEFSFVINRQTTGVMEGACNLIINALLMKPRNYTRAGCIVPEFFDKLLNIFDVSPFRLFIGDINYQGRVFTTWVYLYPKEPEKNMISINGYVYPYDLRYFPTIYFTKENRRLRNMDRQALRRANGKFVKKD